LLVATILSAQCTDARVNQVTPGLFARYPTPAALAAATTEELEPQLQPTGFFRMKSKSLLGMSRALIEKHGGGSLPTWTRSSNCPAWVCKTANVVPGQRSVCPPCLSIGMSCALPTASASSTQTMP
jgi:endonuclease-3